MKRKFTLLILMLISFTAFSQWNEESNIDGKCAHIPTDFPMTLDYLYDWQSPLLEDYDAKFYFLDIEISNTSTFVSGNVTLKAESVVALDTFAFELITPMTINKILFEGVEYTNYSRQGDNVLVPVTEVPQGTLFTAQVFYEGDPGSGGFFSGLSKAYSEQYDKHVVWTLSEPFAAKEWWPVKQDLEDKIDSCWVFLTTSSTNMAGSQGLLTNVVDLGDGNSRYEWKSKYPIDYYLISFAVADYMDYSIYAYPDEMEGDSILIQNFIYNDPACLANNKDEIDETAAMIDLFSEKYILYPFSEEKYGHCLTQLGGGMEHQTMTTIGGFGFGLVSHELGHMWFGDNVTCATWSDIWINEGFATYSNALAEEFLHGPESGRSFMIGCQNNAMSQPGGSTYIPESQISQNDVWRIFDGRLSYRKGAAILHTLRHEIQDDDMFFDVMRTFQIEYTGGTATGDDFRNTAEEVTGMEFEQFFDQWYYGEGYPTYDIKFYMTGGTFNLVATQTPSSSATPLFEMLMDYQLYFDDGSDTLVQFMQTDNINHFELYTGKDVLGVIVDPYEWTMEKVSGVSVTLEETKLPVYFSVGPNPVQDQMNIYFLNPSNNAREISIYDIAGKLVYYTSTEQDRIKINSAQFSNGVYLVKVFDGKNEFVKRIIK
jgi:aminopeptidase N